MLPGSGLLGSWLLGSWLLDPSSPPSSVGLAVQPSSFRPARPASTSSTFSLVSSLPPKISKSWKLKFHGGLVQSSSPPTTNNRHPQNLPMMRHSLHPVRLSAPSHRPPCSVIRSPVHAASVLGVAARVA